MKNRLSTIISHSKRNNLRHGHVFSPASRAYFANQQGLLDWGALNQREAGKFFPETHSGLTDPLAPQDIVNDLPPPDGKIASANQSTGAFLDEPGTQWQKHDVLSGEVLRISWNYSAPHATRRWNYFITREGWDPNLPLSRQQFEEKPFFQVQLSEQPYWDSTVATALTPPQPTEHDVILPERSGYHVLLAVWEVANTGNAFYQVVDLNFVGDGIQEPLPPTGLTINEVTKNSVSLSWDESSSAVSYNVFRDGKLVEQTSALNFLDENLLPDTTYKYAVSAIYSSGYESALSTTVTTRTLVEHDDESAPEAPRNLQSIDINPTDVTIMWSPQSDVDNLKGYIIFRDGNRISDVTYLQTSYKDSGLRPSTKYSYFVVAQNVQGVISKPSNSVEVITAAGESTTYPEWQLGSYYPAGARVSYDGNNYMCLQSHTAYTQEWSPSNSGLVVLWQRID